MIGLIIFGVLVFAGFVALIVVKIRWSRQAARKWAKVTTANAAVE